MKFLIDNAISFRVVEILRELEYEAVHVRELGMAAASDETLVKHAIYHEQIIVSADNDFGKILAAMNSQKPSVILFRWAGLRRADDQINVLVPNLPSLQTWLEKGAIVTITPKGIRVRQLPLRGDK